MIYKVFDLQKCSICNYYNIINKWLIVMKYNAQCNIDVLKWKQEYEISRNFKSKIMFWKNWTKFNDLKKWL